MKKKVSWILKMAAFYSILGLILQGIFVNVLLAVTPIAGQDLKDVKMTINLQNVSLEEVFKTVEQNSDFRFVYIDKEIPLRKKLTVDRDDESLYEILTFLARECGLAFNRVDYQLIVKKEERKVPPKKINLTGIVYDTNTKEPIEFANVINKKNNAGASTDEKGNFTFLVDEGKIELQVSYIGYRTEVIDVSVENEDLFVQIPLVKTDVLLQEVSVYSKTLDTLTSKSVSSVSLQSKRIEQISGLLPDVFRSIQLLPGIAVNNEYSAKFNVRGGNYDENLVLVNGTQIYEPFHLKEAENASVGIFNINLMNNVEMITGGFSAMYGDRLSSVLNIEYREGNKDKMASSATLSLTNLDGLIEGPIGSQGSFLLGVRKSYLEYALSMLGADDYAKPAFYDLQGILTYSLSSSNKIQLKFIHSGDDFTSNPGYKSSSPISGKGTFGTTPATFASLQASYAENNGKYFNNLLDVQNTLILSGKAILKSSFSFYEQLDDVHHMDSTYYRLDIKTTNNLFYLSKYLFTYDNYLRIRTMEGKISLDYQITPFYEIRSGFSYQKLNYSQDLTNLWNQDVLQNYNTYPRKEVKNYSNQPSNYTGEKINASSFKVSGYVENVFQLDKNFLINAGGRFDYFDINKDLNLSPRLSLSYKTKLGTIIRAAWGYYFQSPIYNQLISAEKSDTNTQAQKAIHYILGLENVFDLGDNGTQTLTAKLEGFYKKYSSLISSSTDSYGRITYSRKNDSEGYASGFDLYAILNVPGFYSWLCYEYLMSKENFTNDLSKIFSRYTDQHHTISFVADFDLGEKWDLNIRATYGSGFAYTKYFPEMDPVNYSWKWVAGEKNSSRIPEYKRVDVRVSKVLEVWDLKADLFLDISNVLNFKNIMGYNYRFNDNGIPITEEVKLWPIIPSVGFTIHF
jgi:hypothetical protein